MSSAQIQFECWRQVKSPRHSWGLAWFLANEICKRFYSSHGVIPWVIDHDGLGYYGISINHVGCKVQDASAEPFGRLTIGGDVENWRNGGPGDHRLKAMDMCSRGESTQNLVSETMRHLRLGVVPSISHSGCRHKRWGSSYELCFEVATILALKNEPCELMIWNHPIHTKPHILKDDPDKSMSEHPGAFLFVRGDRELLLTGDGRLLGNSKANLWHRYMEGADARTLAELVAKQLDL